MKPYESYKETNIPWVKEIPSHWIFLRNKNVLSEQKDTVGENSSNYTLLSLTLNGVIKRDMVNAKGKFPKDFDTYKIVKNGDIIFCLFDIDETPRTVGLSKHNGMITGAYDVFHIENINPQYLYYYYLSIDNAKAMKPLYTGLRKVIGVTTFLGTKLPVPPRAEQDQIVRYLDWQLSKINKLIKAKKKQIELLNEQKQAVINKAVTKGLDDTVPMKDSGVEWIGEIPRGWGKNKTIRLFSMIGSGTTPQSGNLKYYKEGNIPWINSGDLSTNELFLKTSSKYVTSLALEDYSVLKMYPENTIVIAMYGASIGNSSIIQTEFCVNQACCCLSIPVESLNLLFAYYAFHSCKSSLIEKSKGGGQPNISQDLIKQTWLPIPPLSEQGEIVQYITRISNDLDKCVLRIQAELDLLAEYKTSLISAVVTGKVDVRDIEIPDFEIDDDQQDIDEIEELDDVEESEVE